MRCLLLTPFVLALGALVGCVVRDNDARTTIRYAVWGSVAQQAAEQRIVDRFESENPDVRVEVFAIGKRYDEKIQSMIVGGVAPDVLMVIMEHYAGWASRGVLADLTPIAARLERDDSMMPVPRRAFQYHGRFFAQPINFHGLVTYVNLDALAAIGESAPEEGWTWTEIESMGPRLSRRVGGERAPVEYAMIAPPYFPTLREFGGSLFDDPDNPRRVTIDSPETRAWVAWYRRLNDSGWVAPQDVAADAGTYQLFRDGRIAFYFSGRWQVPDFDGKTDFRWDVRPFPAGPRGRVTMHGGSGIAVSSASSHPEAARRFVEFYAGLEGAKAAMREGRTVPVWRVLAHSESFLGLRPPASPQHFVETMEEGQSSFWLYAPGAAEVAQMVTRRMEEALAVRQLTPEQVTRRLRKDLERWLERQQRRKERRS